MTPEALLPGSLHVEPKVPLTSDPLYWPSVAAAVIDEQRAAWTPNVAEYGLEPNHYQFTRAHVQILHDCGCTKQQALDYAEQFLSPPLVAKLATDLDSYGEWA